MAGHHTVRCTIVMGVNNETRGKNWSGLQRGRSTIVIECFKEGWSGLHPKLVEWRAKE